MRLPNILFGSLVFALCVAFIPVWLHFGLALYVFPISFILFDRAARFLGYLRPAQTEFMLILYCLFYLSVFAVASYYLTHFTAKLANRTAVLARVLICLVAFACSFLPIITYSSLSGQGGRYTFWTAIPRYLEKQFKYK